MPRNNPNQEGGSTVDNETVITLSDGDSLTYVYPPEFRFNVNDRFKLFDTVMFRGDDGETKEQTAVYYEIVRRDREYVVEEDEWYVNYRVRFYSPIHEELCEKSLSGDDIAGDGCEKTDKSPEELIDEWASSGGETLVM